MRLEKQNIPTPSRPKINARFRQYESEIQSLRAKLGRLSSDRAALFGSRYTDDPSGAGAPTSDEQLEQRQQLLDGTERLERSSNRLKASRALAHQTEEIGVSTLETLGRQREQIVHAQGTLEASEGYVNRSVNTLRGMARR